MTTITWSDAWALDLPLMDDTHREFINLLAAVQAAPDAALADAWDALLAHTREHFEREDAWMRDTRFSSSNCHSTQHHVVLQVMAEVQKRSRTQTHTEPHTPADLTLVREMAKELALWFAQHAQSMDAALALHLRRVGYDVDTGQIHAPQALPSVLIEGCGGSDCSTAQTHPAADQAVPA